jgi:hypothetical protein
MGCFKGKSINGLGPAVRGRTIFFSLTFSLILLAASPAHASGGTCPTGTTIDPNGNPITLANLGITSCFYVSKANGSDSNSGTSESSPWAHLPGMPSCSGNCSSIDPSAGEGFILRGGDTWVSSDLGVNWNWSGTISNPIYIGVDQTWFNSSCGSSWCRPVWNAQSSTNSTMFLAGSNSTWWISDNIEMVGMRNNQNGYWVQGAQNVRITQNYFHAWSHTGNSDNVGFFSQGGAGSMADHNIIDGSDSTKNTFNAFFSYWSRIQYNYINYVVSGVLGNTDVVHDNVVLNTVTSADGDHCNGIFTFSPESGLSQLIYNNVISNGRACPGGVVLWFNGNSGGNASWVGYGFNNVLWDLSSNQINIGNHGTTNYGTYYWFNNTGDFTAGGTPGTPGNGYWTMYDNNNHGIPGPFDFNSSGYGGPTPTPCNAGSGSGCTDLTQTESVANGQGYTSSETYAYSPVSGCTPSTCSTVQAGTNLASTYCASLSSISAGAGAACLMSTTFGCSEVASNHTLTCPAMTPTARPSTGAWDIGAYQFGQDPPPNPPTGLTAVVN